ncbi:uncharacterized protein [Asterias amurensis]|uniref:uncharacterized protein isoform X1 n=1 Tax=Asterias amurensis TaxID=7602 RepID=UPI003AB6C322
MNRVLMLRSLVPQARLNFSTSVRSQLESKIKEGQSKFQTNDWQNEAVKAGRNVDPRVRIAYNAAMSIAGVCFAFLGYAFYIAAGKAEQKRKT